MTNDQIQTTVNTNSFLDMNSIVNTAINGYMVKLLASMNSKGFKPKTILIFLLLLSIGELRTSLSDIIRESRKNLPKLILKAFEYFLKIARRPLKLFQRVDTSHKEIAVITKDDQKISKIKVEIIPNNYIITAIHKYCQSINLNKCSNDFRVKTESSRDRLYTKEYRGIVFTVDDLKIRVFNNLEIDYDIESNVKSYQIDRNGKPKSDEPYLIGNTTIPWEEGWLCNRIFKENKSFYNIMEKYLKKYQGRKLHPSYEELINFCNAGKLSTKYPNNEVCKNISSDKSSYNLCELLLSFIYEEFNFVASSTKHIRDNLLTVICLTKSIIEYYSKIDNLKFEFKNKGFKLIIDNWSLINATHDIKHEIDGSILKLDQNRKLIIPKDFDIEKYICLEEESSKNLKFIVTSPNKVENDQLYKKFLTFYEGSILSSNIRSLDSSQVSVYSIDIKNEEHKTKISNPEHDKWKEEYTSLQGMKECEVIEKRLVDLLSKKPSETIDQVTFTQSICTNVINKCKKPINTLYLRQDDKNIFINTLDRFKNNREFYDNLGIPYKLGMLFHGVPGTGKSSAIKAAASYLGRDIYYVHLKNIKTNTQLKNVFEHINDKCNGGIVILEDIDAATEVVYKRSESDISLDSPTMTDCLDESEDKLTLSYLLNILDGTLCCDGTIFVITTNHLEKLDPALYRKGRIDVTLEFKKCDRFQISEIYESIMRRKLSTDILNSISEDKYPPCDIIFHICQYTVNEKMTDREIMAPFL